MNKAITRVNTKSCLVVFVDIPYYVTPLLRDPFGHMRYIAQMSALGTAELERRGVIRGVCALKLTV